MNKRAIVKLSIFGICVFAILLIFFFIQLTYSSASEEINTYYNLGDKVKIDFDASYSYTLKTTYPDGKSTIKKGVAQSVIFEPPVLGKYSLDIYYGGKSTDLHFEVVNFLTDEASSASSSNLFSSYQRYEYSSGTNEFLNQSQVVVGRDFLWKSDYSITSDKALEFSVPKYASQIKIKNNGVEKSYSEKEGIAYSLQTFLGVQKNKSYIVDVSSGLVELEYYTSGPQKSEKEFSKNHKEVVVYDSNEAGYTNILSFTSLDDTLPLAESNKIKVFWKEENKYLDFIVDDYNNNGKIDLVSWIVPHLSNQTFEIIISASKASHLDFNRVFLEDIFESISTRDYIYSSEIFDGEYVRVSFEKNLTNKNDITLVPKIISGKPYIEVYEKDSSFLLATFDNLISNDFNKIYLTNLIGEQDTFDLRIIDGSVAFDYIYDPYNETVVNFTSSTSWTVPAGATEVVVEVWGAGGRGGKRTTTGVGGGGGGGAYSRKTFTVAPGTNYDVFVGAGGNDSNVNGGDSYFGDTSTVLAKGGSGVADNSATGANGGASSSGVGDVKYSGGNGANGVAGSYGGGGGSSAGNSTAGNNGSGSTGGSAPTAGGAGGNGGTSKNAAGSAGSVPGGGGGGARRQGGKLAGGSGAAGYVRVTYRVYLVGNLGVMLTSPGLNQVFNNHTISFNFTPTTNGAFANCSLWDNSTGTWGINQTNTTSISNGTYNYLSKTYVTNDSILWNIQCCDNTNGCVFGASNRTFSFDVTPPTVLLISPADNAPITDDSGLVFGFNVSDVSSVDNCSLLVNGLPVTTNSLIFKDQSLNFNYYLENGIYTWAVSCLDNAGNVGVSSNRTANVSISYGAMSNVWWLTGTSDFTGNEIAYNFLRNTRDATSNSASFSIGGTTLVTLANSTSNMMTHNGAVIPSGSSVTFSSAFSTRSSNVKITWKLYISNSSGEFLICQIGDDAGGGTSCASTSSTANNTCINRDIYLQSYDKLRLVTRGYNSAGSARDIVYVWDEPYDSFVNVNVTTEGFIDVNLSSSDSQEVPLNDVFNATCTLNCSIGYCRNTTVYIQENSSGIWRNINSTSGIIVLGSGETNPHSLGNMGTTFVSNNFTLKGNILSSTNVRCISTTNYDSANGTNFSQVTVTSAGSTAPVVNVTSPGNATWWNTTSIVFYYNASDINSNLANATLILNGTANQTNQTALVNNAINNITVTGLSDGVYNWTVNVTDSTGLTGQGNETRIIYIDTKKPILELFYPAHLDYFEVSTLVFNFTVSDNMDSNLTCNLSVDGVNKYTNFGADNSSIINKTVSGLTIGNHSWYVSCIDNAQNINMSETRNFSVQDLPPSIILITQNLTWFNTSSVNLTYNASDNNNISLAYLFINGLFNQTNQSEVINGAYNNFTLNSLADGSYWWYVNVTDTGGFNSTNLSKLFYVDTHAPQINLTGPTNITFSNSSSYNFNFTAIDNMVSPINCNLSVSEKVTAFSATNASNKNTLVIALTDGVKIWNVSCIDSALNYNVSESRQITITEYPRITLVTPNASFFNYTDINLTYTPSDNSNLSVCSLYLNGAYNQSNSSVIVNGVQRNFSVFLSEGFYNWYVNCTDTYGLTNVSETKYFTIDTQTMSVDLYYPNPGEEIFSKSINFSYKATDSVDPFLDCNVTVNGQKLDNYTSQNGTIVNRTVVFSTGGIKYWNVTCRDDSGNTEVSETRNFTLAFAPVINLTYPLNATWFNVSQVNFSYYIEDDNDNIANSTLILNGFANQTNQTEIVNYDINDFSVFLPEGRYNWTVNATDSTNLESTGNTTRVFYVDLHAPSVSVNSPNDTQTLDWNNITFSFNVSDNLDSSVLCNLTVNSSSSYDEIENILMNNGTPTTYYLSKSDGYYNWFLTCADKAGNINQTVERFFTVEAPPRVTNLAPTNNQYFNTSSITFVYLPEDVFGLYNCSLFIDNVFTVNSSSITKNQNNSFSVDDIPEGLHNWTVGCYDSAPDFNLGFSTVTNFYVDFTPPLVTLNSPLNDSGIYRNQSLLRWYFNFTSNDTLDLNLRCNVSLDGVRNKTNILVTGNIPYSDYISGITLGYHNWSVSCKDSANNTNSSQTYFFNYTYPDFMVNSSLVVLNNSMPKENEPINISATIYNLGFADGNNTLVRFYNGNPSSGGVQIGSDQRINFSRNSQQVVSQLWSAGIGTSDIYCVVDYPTATNGSFYELNETNNVAFQTSTVGGWELFTGVISSGSEFALADNSTNRVINWSSNDFVQGNIYVLDYESSIDWSSLVAIGKTKSGTDSSNDFSEIDSSLGMSTFSDSVYNTFTNSGTPKELTNVSIFKHVVNSVPIINSTNNTNFVTGILWDSSQSLDNEYDSSEKEDLVFLAVINKSQQGAYGEYDYEAKIPAKLREYKVVDTKSVVFYVELV